MVWVDGYIIIMWSHMTLKIYKNKLIKTKSVKIVNIFIIPFNNNWISLKLTKYCDKNCIFSLLIVQGIDKIILLKDGQGCIRY